MTPAFILAELIDPGLAFMARTIGPKPSDTPDARVMLLAISGQEGDFRYRRQIGGPARSIFQFEQRGGVAGVLAHPVAGPWARQICDALSIPSDAPTVYEAIAWSDHLAVAMARLLLFTDPAPLPSDEAGGWDLYARLWRPGRPGPDRWAGNFEAASAAVKGTTT